MRVFKIATILAFAVVANANASSTAMGDSIISTLFDFIDNKAIRTKVSFDKLPRRVQEEASAYKGQEFFRLDSVTYTTEGKDGYEKYTGYFPLTQYRAFRAFMIKDGVVRKALRTKCIPRESYSIINNYKEEEKVLRGAYYERSAPAESLDLISYIGSSSYHPSVRALMERKGVNPDQILPFFFYQITKSGNPKNAISKNKSYTKEYSEEFRESSFSFTGNAQDFLEMMRQKRFF